VTLSDIGSKCFSSRCYGRLSVSGVWHHLFGRRYIPAKFQDANLKFYQSKVFLEDLPEDFKAALDEYNMNVTKGFASFLLVVSKLADMKQEHQLPLSKIGKWVLALLWNNLETESSCLRLFDPR
ncbi:putative ATP-dependent RNA helicase DDX60, partial [Camelus dromedarius]